jgi:hypothetical protein
MAVDVEDCPLEPVRVPSLPHPVEEHGCRRDEEPAGHHDTFRMARARQ